MNFGEKFKKIRTDLKLTQEQVAARLCVSRQAVSNWENNKNLPDIEMIVTISQAFGLTLDQLMLDGQAENNLTEKLIQDTSENKRAKINLLIVCIAVVLLLIGVGCVLIKAFSVEYIDELGRLHENFFLLPIGFLFIICALITFSVAGIRGLTAYLRNRRSRRIAPDAESPAPE